MGGQILREWHLGYLCNAQKLSTFFQFMPGGFNAFRCDISSAQKGTEVGVVHPYPRTSKQHSRSTRSPAMAERSINIILLSFYPLGCSSEDRFNWPDVHGFFYKSSFLQFRKTLVVYINAKNAQ